MIEVVLHLLHGFGVKRKQALAAGTRATHDIRALQHAQCLVTACRVSREPAVSWAIDADSPELSRATSASRVLSPSAAKSTACEGRPGRLRLGFFRDISLDILHLLRPAAVIPAQGVVAPFDRNVLKPRFGDYEQCAVSDPL